VPRITAATVPEHRAAQERALLDAAHALLRETGEAPTMAQLADGRLARSSVYEVFGSRHEVLSALVRDLLPRWIDRIRAAMRAAPSPAEAILAYACTNVALVAEGSHAPGEALAALAPGRETDDRAARMHAEITHPRGEDLPSSASNRGVRGRVVNALVYAGVQCRAVRRWTSDRATSRWCSAARPFAARGHSGIADVAIRDTPAAEMRGERYDRTEMMIWRGRRPETSWPD